MEASPEVKELIDHKNNLSRYLCYGAKNQITKVEISATNKKIFSTCKHNWVRDWDAPFDSHCKKICSFCKLYANPHYNA